MTDAYLVLASLFPGSYQLEVPSMTYNPLGIIAIVKWVFYVFKLIEYFQHFGIIPFELLYCTLVVSGGFCLELFAVLKSF